MKITSNILCHDLFVSLSLQHSKLAYPPLYEKDFPIHLEKKRLRECTLVSVHHLGIPAAL